jgi:hypothetical protein
MRFDDVELGRKSPEQKIKDERKRLAQQIRELSKEFELDLNTAHITDLLRKLDEPA